MGLLVGLLFFVLMSIASVTSKPMSEEMLRQWQSFYDDVAVLAFPTPTAEGTIADADEKALYYRT